ncbi:predicted protein [Nematostella vectensis]|uniref:PX domain-containing protein n=1 Tax=Nematostella vectensis TaxID=45351 RepID=A7S7T4_NEMVE|nr:predicted protein [Nematostella vectensis]|eukprot:XP_001632357.1 predicted protein [Nematostella vectensis]
MASDVRSPYISDSACFWSKPTPSRDAPCDMHVTVRDPRTHVKDMRAQYTDYKIETEGSSDIMPLGACTVRRRYSEFTWLRKKLAEEFPNASIPPLPGKRVLGRFDTEFIKNRQQGLEHWLRSLLSDTYKENAYLQLFLQTDLDTGDIQKCLRHKDRQDLYHVILLAANHRHNNNNNRSSRHSTADSAIDSICSSLSTCDVTQSFQRSGYNADDEGSDCFSDQSNRSTTINCELSFDATSEDSATGSFSTNDLEFSSKDVVSLERGPCKRVVPALPCYRECEKLVEYSFAVSANTRDTYTVYAMASSDGKRRPRERWLRRQIEEYEVLSVL